MDRREGLTNSAIQRQATRASDRDRAASIAMAHLEGVIIIRSAKEDIETHKIGGMRPIDELVGDQMLVRDQVIFTIACNHTDVSYT